MGLTPAAQATRAVSTTSEEWLRAPPLSHASRGATTDARSCLLVDSRRLQLTARFFFAFGAATRAPPSQGPVARTDLTEFAAGPATAGPHEYRSRTFVRPSSALRRLTPAGRHCQRVSSS